MTENQTIIETIQDFITININDKMQILELFYNLSYSLLPFSFSRFHKPNKDNLLNILKIISKRHLDTKFPELQNRRKNEVISKFINLCRELFKTYFNNNENFNRNDESLRVFLFDEDYFNQIIENLEIINENDKHTLLWVIKAILDENTSQIDHNYKQNYILLYNNVISILNYNSNQQLNTNFNRNINIKTIWELENLWTPIERNQCKHRREQPYIFWGIGDFIVKYGLGYWSPYFTYKNNYQDKDFINVNLILSKLIVERIIEIYGDLYVNVPELEELPSNLNTFIEPTHNWITRYLCNNISLFDIDVINVQREYETNEAGKIDILLEDLNGTYWVVEIKTDRANYNAIGQILNYMNWVRENRNRQVKGIIIVKSISPQLRTAFRELNRTDINIWTYEVSENEQITLDKIL